MRQLMPEWLPLVGLDLGKTNVVPVDWVAGALDHIAHEPDLDGQRLPPDRPAPPARGRAVQRVRRRRARAEVRGQRRQTADGRAAEVAAVAGAARCRRCARPQSLTLRELGIPEEVLAHMELMPEFDTREAERALKGSALESRRRCTTTRARLWDYWEREMDAARRAGAR